MHFVLLSSTADFGIKVRYTSVTSVLQFIVVDNIRFLKVVAIWFFKCLIFCGKANSLNFVVLSLSVYLLQGVKVLRDYSIGRPGSWNIYQTMSRRNEATSGSWEPHARTRPRAPIVSPPVGGHSQQPCDFPNPSKTLKPSNVNVSPWLLRFPKEVSRRCYKMPDLRTVWIRLRQIDTPYRTRHAMPAPFLLLFDDIFPVHFVLVPKFFHVSAH